MIKGPRLSTKEISFVAVMTGLSLATNYMMVGFLNVKFMDLFVFVSGYVMGSFVGVLVGSFTWLIYGTINPYGFDLSTLFATMAGESLYGFVGGSVSKLGLLDTPNPYDQRGLPLSSKGFWLSNLKFAFLGFLLTFIYDLFTNVVTSLVYGLPILVVLIFGVRFALIHEVSNFFFFLFGASVLIRTVQSFMFKRR